MPDDFTWQDGERTIRFGDGVAAEAPELLQPFGGFHLVTTERAERSVPGLSDLAEAVIRVPPGKVDEISADLLDEVPAGTPLVALGGGRVVDAAKALAGAMGGACAAIPTTLSGAEMTASHRLPRGVEGARTVRPTLVIADPDLMASAPPTRLAASAMNAMAHAMEALYTRFRSPVSDLAALRAATLIGDGVTEDARGDLALGAILAGYACGAARIAFHHAVCQTLVRTAGTPHAETNAVVLPHSARLAATRAPGAIEELGRALGDPGATPAALSRLAARCGHTRLSTLGVTEDHLGPAAAAVLDHPALANMPDPPGEDELLGLLRAAL